MYKYKYKYVYINMSPKYDQKHHQIFQVKLIKVDKVNQSQINVYNITTR